MTAGIEDPQNMRENARWYIAPQHAKSSAAAFVLYLALPHGTRPWFIPLAVRLVAP